MRECTYTDIIGLVLYILGTPKFPYLFLKCPCLSLHDYNDISYTSISANVLSAYYGLVIINNTGLTGLEPHTLEAWLPA